MAPIKLVTTPGTALQQTTIFTLAPPGMLPASIIRALSDQSTTPPKQGHGAWSRTFFKISG